MGLLVKDAQNTSSVKPVTITGTMLAARYQEGYKELILEAVTIPQPGFGEVLLKIEATGMCRTDIHVLEGEFPLPGNFTMGHEVAGTAVVLGPGITEIVEHPYRTFAKLDKLNSSRSVR